MHCTYHRKRLPSERAQLHVLATHENLSDQTLTAYAHCSIRSSVARRTFEQCFPPLTIKTFVGAGWRKESVVLEAPVLVVSIISASTDQMTGRVYLSWVDIQRIHISTNNGPSGCLGISSPCAHPPHPYLLYSN